jgi:hypothetical protein
MLRRSSVWQDGVERRRRCARQPAIRELMLDVSKIGAGNEIRTHDPNLGKDKVLLIRLLHCNPCNTLCFPYSLILQCFVFPRDDLCASERLLNPAIMATEWLHAHLDGDPAYQGNDISRSG